MIEFYLYLPRLVRRSALFFGVFVICNEHARDLTNTANVVYTKYVSGEKIAAREQCLDFKKNEMRLQTGCNNVLKEVYIWRIQYANRKRDY